MDRPQIDTGAFPCSAINDDVLTDEYLAAHCERAAEYVPGQKERVFDVVFDQQASRSHFQPVLTESERKQAEKLLKREELQGRKKIARIILLTVFFIAIMSFITAAIHHR